MARSFWKGTLSFGLVEIGVMLQPARSAHDLSFSLLDRRDFSPVGFRRYNKRTGKEVPWDRIVKGYEYEPEQYVVLTDDELRSANAEASQTIDLVTFVDRSEIEPVYYDTPYFVLPARRGSRGYTLLRDVLVNTGFVGIVRIVLRTRHHVAALLVHDGLLMLETLRHSEELRPAQEVTDASVESEPGHTRGAGRPKARAKRAPLRLSGPAAKATPAELKMATRLVEEMREPWKPAEYRDEYRGYVMTMIRKKIKAGKTHEIVVDPEKTERSAPREVVDLMPLLQQSLGRRGAAGERRSKVSKVSKLPSLRRPAARTPRLEQPATRRRRA